MAAAAFWLLPVPQGVIRSRVSINALSPALLVYSHKIAARGAGALLIGIRRVASQARLAKWGNSSAGQVEPLVGNVGFGQVIFDGQPHQRVFLGAAQRCAAVTDQVGQVAAVEQGIALLEQILAGP